MQGSLCILLPLKHLHRCPRTSCKSSTSQGAELDSNPGTQQTQLNYRPLASTVGLALAWTFCSAFSTSCLAFSTSCLAFSTSCFGFSTSCFHVLADAESCFSMALRHCFSANSPILWLLPAPSQPAQVAVGSCPARSNGTTRVSCTSDPA